MAARVWRAFVEKHDDVGAQVALDFHGSLRADECRCAIQVVLEMHPLLGDFAELREGENLKPSAVRQDRAIPRHETMQTPKAGDELFARPDMEVVGIPQNDLRAQATQFVRTHRLHSGLGPDRHEDRCLDRAPARMDSRRSCPAVRGFEREGSTQWLLTSLEPHPRGRGRCRSHPRLCRGSHPA